MSDSQQSIVRGSKDDRSDRPDGVLLAGYIRRPEPRGVRKPLKGVRRLYRTPTSKTYVDIKRADILDLPHAGVQLAPGQIAIWVRAEAEWSVTFGANEPRLLGRPGWPRR